jgi:hypothetical protein
MNKIMECQVGIPAPPSRLFLGGKRSRCGEEANFGQVKTQ